MWQSALGSSFGLWCTWFLHIIMDAPQWFAWFLFSTSYNLWVGKIENSWKESQELWIQISESLWERPSPTPSISLSLSLPLFRAMYLVNWQFAKYADCSAGCSFIGKMFQRVDCCFRSLRRGFKARGVVWTGLVREAEKGEHERRFRRENKTSEQVYYQLLPQAAEGDQFSRTVGQKL